MLEKEIDYGKIKALHNAGWGRAKIADEMRMTEDEYIKNIIGELGKVDEQIARLEKEYYSLYQFLM